MKTRALSAWVALTLSVAGAAHAQDAGLSVAVGAKVWNTQWTTFGYYPIPALPNQQQVLTQVVAEDKVVLLPVLSLRWRDFVGSFSAYQSSHHQFSDGTGNTRAEYDANVGYLVLPGLAVTLGYKKVAQKGDYKYEPAGLVLGLSGTAPVGEAFSLYGAFGFGRLKTPSANGNPRIAEFDADYRLTELGLAYGLAVGRVAKTLTFTAGYRTQALTSKNALGSQDGRDLTQGLTLGLLASF